MSNGLYILVDGQPVPEPDVDKWGKWFQTADRHLAQFRTAEGLNVSTVFLGMDHNFGRGGNPVLWETMIFGDDNYQYFQERYTSAEAALAGHQIAVALARGKTLLRDPLKKKVKMKKRRFGGLLLL